MHKTSNNELIRRLQPMTFYNSFRAPPPERQQGWWTNFSEDYRSVYEQLVKDYNGPGRLVIREPVAPAPKSYGGSLWVEPCPADWREWQALNNAVKATPFWENLRKAMNI